MALRIPLLVLLAVLLATLLTPAAPAVGQSDTLTCPELPAHMEGRLVFRGDRWPVRLRIVRQPVAGAPGSAEIDLPELLMAGRPAALRCEGGHHVLGLPFGFGDVPLQPHSEGSYRGEIELADDPLRLTFSAGPSPPYRVEALSFTSGGAELVGSLYVPNGGAPHPAVVVVHGSGPQGRELLEYRSWGDHYARLGLATLVYDKRGVGESGGDYRTDSAFVALTGDVLAAVERLRQHPAVDPTRIGLSGASQAGWIAYRAARDPRVAFLALLVAPSTTVAEQEVQRVREGMRADGFDEPAVARAVAHTRLMLAVAETGLGWEGLAASGDAIADEAWADRVHRPEQLEALRWWRDHAAFDPRPDLVALRVPLFAAFSAEDRVVPPGENAGPLRELAAARAGMDITVVTAPRGNHRLEVAAGVHDGHWHLPRLSRPVLAAMEQWLRTRWARPTGG